MLSHNSFILSRNQVIHGGFTNSGMVAGKFILSNTQKNYENKKKYGFCESEIEHKLIT